MLQFYVPMEISWRNIGPHIPHRHENLFQIVYRAVTVIFITIIAIVVPDLSAIIDIVGSVFYATLGIFTPCLLDIILNWYIGYGIFKWRLCKNLLIMALAIFVLCSGVYFASSTLINGTIPPGSLCKNGTLLE
ncbi:hypothetical protein WA026_009357 [Henosepilachna vigintioctopunctata]|uniref:Amino acid transporter transmembrane domain-containing protein n=1 Tax=Henosepilachna vigintioctopunctata TaxID=420089 RepID=A0AAW1U8B5_9CUCU